MDRKDPVLFEKGPGERDIVLCEVPPRSRNDVIAP